MIDLAKEYFRIDRYKNLSLHIEDADDFVEKLRQEFDLVVVDTFVGADVRTKFKEEKFLAGLGRLCRPVEYLSSMLLSTMKGEERLRKPV